MSETAELNSQALTRTDELRRELGIRNWDDVKIQTPKSLDHLERLAVPEMVDKWYSIGIQLEFQPIQLNKIKDNHQPCPVEETCEKMFMEWLKSTKISWKPNLQNDLIEAVKNVGYAVHADKFKKDMNNGADIVDYKYLNGTVAPRVATKWYQIGLKLDIDSFKLDNIRREIDRTTEQCLEMLREWLNRSSEEAESFRPTWENMHKAMTALDLNAGAERLKGKLVLEEDT